MQTTKFTFFWRTASPFSQWHPSDFKLDGKGFNCAEQYMMWRKAKLFKDEKMAKAILKAKSPGQQKALGRQVQGFNAKIWDKHAREIVYQANFAKFSQNFNLKTHLLKTVGTELVEASPNDAIWGIGLAEEDPAASIKSQWRGKNWLGKVLDRVRTKLLED